MIVKHISLTNFRLYARLEIDLKRGLVIVQGDNAQGKTSLLEALYFLATAHSPHTNADRQIIRWGAEEDGPFPYAMLKANIERSDGSHLLEMMIQKGEGGRIKKEIRIDRTPRRSVDLIGQLSVVLFLPSDVELVYGPPAARRDFIDAALSQVDAEYVRALDRYEKALSQRNALLRQSGERRIDPDELAVWDEQLAPDGVAISLARRRALSELAQLALPLHRELSNAAEFLQIMYQPSFDATQPNAVDEAYQIGFDTTQPPAGMNEADLCKAFQTALTTRRSEELARGVTLTGPHRDEFRFIANGMDLGEFGSRGQQRTAVLALKLAQVAWMRERTKEEPILLLDEVLAELDPHRRRCLLRHIGDSQQTVITTTDIHQLEREQLPDAASLTVRLGVISTS
ncbi:MAG: DNA replication/repair protein RecF [Chloroflexi bacterium]|nr:DNA replication/repair protein RecF [Chloroflexota bacterium]